MYLYRIVNKPTDDYFKLLVNLTYLHTYEATKLYQPKLYHIILLSFQSITRRKWTNLRKKLLNWK